MSLPRLPFLYPQLFRSPRSWEACTNFGNRPPPRKQHQAALFHSSTRCKQGSTIPQRYGPATEPLPPPSKAKQDEKSLLSPKEPEIPNEKKQAKPAVGDRTNQEKEKKAATTASKEPTPKQSTTNQDTSKETTAKLDAGELHASEPAKDPTLETKREQVPAELERVLHMDPPTAKKSDEAKSTTPHMQAAPYVHHFDTYTLVKDLSKSNFSQDQSVTIMKAVRSLLAVNLDMAKDGLVSKSDVENETYLFRAACSELKTEIMNSRKREAENMRSERAHLQHEVDILSQRLTQESGALKDDLKGMFDDRKMATRMEQRSMESSIQELNYKITVGLVGDSKGEVEGLRWFLTRRAAMFIGSMACKYRRLLKEATWLMNCSAHACVSAILNVYSSSGSRAEEESADRYLF